MLLGLWPFVAAIAFAGISDVASLITVPIQSSTPLPEPYRTVLMPLNYFKPDLSQTSGFPNNNASFSRSPCPALNTLANSDFIRNKGKKITKDSLKRAIMKYFKLAEDAAKALVSRVPNEFSLGDFSQPSFNHKASMFHNDSLSSDPSLVDLGLAQDFLNLADSNGVITIKEVAKFRAKRTLQCQHCTLSPTEVTATFTQAALLLLVFGEGQSINSVSAKSFIVNEKFPDFFTLQKPLISLDQITDTAVELRKLSG